MAYDQVHNETDMSGATDIQGNKPGASAPGGTVSG